MWKKRKKKDFECERRDEDETYCCGSKVTSEFMQVTVDASGKDKDAPDNLLACANIWKGGSAGIR